MLVDIHGLCTCNAETLVHPDSNQGDRNDGDDSSRWCCSGSHHLVCECQPATFGLSGAGQQKPSAVKGLQSWVGVRNVQQHVDSHAEPMHPICVLHHKCSMLSTAIQRLMPPPVNPADSTRQCRPCVPVRNFFPLRLQSPDQALLSECRNRS